MGIRYESVGQAKISVEASDDGVSLVANTDGLRSLLHLFEDLLATSSADHINLTPSMQLTAESHPLIVSCIEPGTAPEKFSAAFDHTSRDARRILRLEAQLLRTEKLLLADFHGTNADTGRHTWIWEENVRTLFETISRWIGYEFDDSDWTAIAEGLKTTDVENGDWYSYPLMGSSRVDVEVSRTVGSAPVDVQITLATPLPALALQVDTLLELLNTTTIKDDRQV